MKTVTWCARPALLILLVPAFCACQDAGRNPATSLTATQAAVETQRAAEWRMAQTVADGEQAAPAAGISSADAAFMIEAALESAYEISVAQLALSKGDHPTVRAYAEMTLRDNARVAVALEALAETKRARLYLHPDPVHVERLVHLRQQRDGYAFDVEYAGLIGRSHDSAIRLYERALEQTHDADIRDFADSALQLLRSRQDEIEMVGADGDA
jgi:putative membrane protein